MKKFLFALLVFLSISFSVYSQNYWIKQYNPFDCRYAGVCDIKESIDGGFIIYGNIIVAPNTASEHKNGIMMKLDNQGEMIWASLDTLGSLGSYSDGKNFIEFNDGCTYSVSQSGINRSCLVKRDIYGDILSVILIPASIESMCKTLDENIIIVGQDMGAPVIKKITTEGDSIWAYSPDYNGQFYSVVKGVDDNYYAVGFQQVASRLINLVGLSEEGEVVAFVNQGLSGYHHHAASIAAGETSLCIAGGAYYLAGADFYGMLAIYDMDSGGIFIQNTNCQFDIGFTSVAYSDDHTFTAFGTNLTKLDHDLNFEWARNNSYNYGGDRQLCYLPNEGYLFPSCNDTTYIEIVKTDLYGEVNDISGYKKLEKSQGLVITNLPNPFNPITTISFSLSESGPVMLEIYNIKGQRIRTLIDEEKIAGTHSVVWNGKDDNEHTVASGVYFCRIKSKDNISSRKMLLLK